MFDAIHLTCPTDVADALREARLRIQKITEWPIISPTAMGLVAEYLGLLEEAVLDHDWASDPDVDDEAVS